MKSAMELVPGLWEVGGKPQGYPIARNMHLYRPPGGGLLVLGAMALPEFGWAEIEALGKPEVVMVASPYHSADEAGFKSRYPGCRLVGPRGALDRIRKEVPVEAAAEDVLPELGIVVHAPAGLRPAEVCLALPIEGGVALWFADMLFNLPHQPGFGGLVTHLIGSSGFLGITRIAKVALLADGQAFQGWLRKMADLDGLSLLLFGHGTAVAGREAARAGLKSAADRLLRT